MAFRFQKILSYLTLFDLTDDYNICEGIFKKVIKIFFHGKNDTKTLEILGIKPLNYHFCNNNNYRKNKLYNYDDNYNNITNFEANEKRYFVNKYKAKIKLNLTIMRTGLIHQMVKKYH